MSAITGVFHVNKSVSYEGNSMLESLKQFPFDSIDNYSKDKIFFGCLAQWIMPENINKKQCFYDYEKRLAITGDVILDNREDLFRHLKVPMAVRNEITDCELILLAYCKWQEDTPKYLIGDFAFMIWDERNNRLFGARDFSGSRTLYYYNDLNLFAFCTVMEPLLQLPYVSNRLNDHWIADYLAIPNIIDSPNGFTTVFKDIQSIPPSHFITVYKGKVTLSRYCTISVDEKIKYKSESEYIEAFQEIFNTAVNSRLRSHKEIGAQLSGGLDSGSVVSIGARSLKKIDKKLHTFSFVPISEYIDWTHKHRVPDEREYIKAIVNYTGNISDLYLDFKNQSPYSEIDNWLNIMEMPYKFFENSVWIKGIYDAAHKKNIGVLLVGSRGNTTISWGPALDYYSEIFKKMKWLKLYRELNLYSVNTGAKKSRILKVIFNKAYPSIYSKNKPYEFPKLISKELEKKTNVYERLNEEGINMDSSFKENIYDIRLKHFEQLNVWNVTGTCGTKLSLRHSMQSHDPTNDLRVIKFCLSLPIDKFFGDGLDRGLIRKATKGFLPDKVRLNQRTRGVQGVDSIQRMSPSWNLFLEELNQLCNDELSRQYLNIDVIKTAITKLNNEIRQEFALDPHFRILMRSIIVYRFLKTLKGGEKMKKEWKAPELEVLNINMTMNGPGIRDVDATYEDEDEIVQLHES
ncbi:paeninodin family lasso peptide [Bacillus sp. NEB1478]|uniref:paeninodin family lasso peptide n=1 Tax=Bacillus sp. NEB1478 TaxID=3073816 RepID=UPI0028733D43|nr:paeninodin family lasso peptide [Bacillus sp. NEB1478]WNB92447.1 paeninodin family lasso peptide [Bacillus sp. NEB1478]